MAANVGGVNVRFGLSTVDFKKGIEVAQEQLSEFRNAVKNIKVAGIIKGDPFSTTRKHLNTARGELDTVFKAWSASVTHANTGISKELMRSQKDIDKLIAKWVQLQKASETSLKHTQKIQQTTSKLSRTGYMDTIRQMDVPRGTPLSVQDYFIGIPDKQEFVGGLREMAKDIPRYADQIHAWLKKFNSNVKLNSKDAKKAFKELNNIVKQANQDLQKQHREFGKTLQQQFIRHDRLEFANQVKGARNVEAALERNRKKVRELFVEEQKLRTEISQGINVQKNRLRLAEIIEKRMARGVKLTREQRQEFRKLKADLDYVKGASDDLFSKKWFMNRARWFIQLRAFWTIWRKTMDAVVGAVAFEQEMANVRAITQATTDQFQMLKKEALEVGSTTRFSAQEAADAMTTMAQAGLDTTEIIGSLKSVAQLATATLNDFKETSELVTTVMRAWGKTAADTQEIVDTLATSTNETRLTMDSLKIGFNYVAGVAPKAGMTLKDTTAVLGMLANNGLRASTAATSLRGVLAELLRPTKKFEDQVKKAGLTMEDVNLEFYRAEDIFLRLKEAGWGVEEVFRAFPRRSATAAAVWVENADKLEDLTDRMYQVNRAAAMSEVNLATIEGQWKQFGDRSIAAADLLTSELSPALQDLAKFLGRSATMLGQFLQPLARLISLSPKGWKDIFAIFTGEYDLREDLDNLKAISDELRNQQAEAQRIVDNFRTLRDAYNKYSEAMKRARSDETLTEKAREALQRRAIGYIRESNLLTIEQENKLEDIKDLTDRRREQEKLINQTYRERLKLAAREWAITEASAKIKREELVSTARPILQDVSERIKNILENIEDISEIEGPDEFGNWEGVLRSFGTVSQVGEKEALRRRLKKELDIIKKTMAPLVPEAIATLLEDADIAKVVSAFTEALRERPKEQAIAFAKAFLGDEVLVTKEIEDTVKDFLDRVGELDRSFEPPEEIRKEFEKLTETLDKQERSLKYLATGVPNYWKSLEKVKDAQEDMIKNINESNASEEEKLKLITKAKKLYEDQRSIIKATRDLELEKSTQDLRTQTMLLDIEESRIKDIMEINRQRKAAIEAERELGGEAEKLDEKIQALHDHYDRLVEIKIEEHDLREAQIEHDLEILEIEKKISDLTRDNETLEALREKEQMLRKQLEFEKGIEETEKNKVSRQQTINKLEGDLADNLNDQIKARNDILKKEHEWTILWLENKRDIADLEKDRLGVLKVEEQIIRENINLLSRIERTDENRLDIARDLNKYNNELVKNLEEQKRLTSVIHDVQQRLKEDAKKETWADIIYDSIKKTSDGLSNTFHTIFGGFQDNKQAVVNLRGEYDDLKNTLDETIDAMNQAFAEEDIQKALELQDEVGNIKNNMQDLNQEIKNLEDPLKSTGEAFREFFKELVDMIRKAVMRMVVLNMVSKIFDIVSPGTTAVDLDTIPAGLKWGSGGVTPTNIKAFRSFSQGGLTGHPTLALLGDNPSKKELVIPSENISKDRVSGYTREREETPINIINVLTSDDVAQAMSTPTGERVVLNMIGRDLRRGGPLYKQLKAV